MNSNDVLIALDKIAEDSSKKNKEALVTKHIQNEMFKTVCELAYNPFQVFGLLPTKADEAIEHGELFFDEVDTLSFLEQLQKRELTGNAARQELAKQLGQLSKESGSLLMRILRKDLRAGFGASTINKACKDFIPVFPYQRCSLPKDTDLSKWPWAKGVFSQLKADGMFVNVTNLKTGVVLSSRQGTPFPIEPFGDLINSISEHLRVDLQYHGELLVERAGKILPREIGNGILNSVIKGGSFEEGDRPVFVVWDLIPITSVRAKGSFDVPYEQRFRLLLAMTRAAARESGLEAPLRLIPTRIVHSLEEAYEHYGELLKKGEEGTVIKHPNAFWKDGTSKEQIKLKLEADCELEIIAVNEGKVGSKNEGRAGAFNCKSACGQLIVDVAVKNEKMRDEVDQAPNDWVGRIVTVRSNQILKPSASNDAHSLFLPRLVEDTYRADKTEADSLERITAQFNNAIQSV